MKDQAKPERERVRERVETFNQIDSGRFHFEKRIKVRKPERVPRVPIDHDARSQSSFGKT